MSAWTRRNPLWATRTTCGVGPRTGASRMSLEVRDLIEHWGEPQRSVQAAFELLNLWGALHGWPPPEDPIDRREDAVVRERFARLTASIRPMTDDQARRRLPIGAARIAAGLRRIGAARNDHRRHCRHRSRCPKADDRHRCHHRGGRARPRRCLRACSTGTDSSRGSNTPTSSPRQRLVMLLRHRPVRCAASTSAWPGCPFEREALARATAFDFERRHRLPVAAVGGPHRAARPMAWRPGDRERHRAAAAQARPEGRSWSGFAVRSDSC